MITFSGGGSSLILPNPQLNDREAIDLRFVYRRMMSGRIRSYKLGPPITVLEIEFANLNRPKVAEVIQFLNATAGKELTYKDYRDVIWRGKLTTLPFEANHSAIRDNRFRLTFEGRNV